MKRIVILSYAILIILGFCFAIATPASAQMVNQWSVPKQIPNYDLIARAPYLAADSNGMVHAFSYEAINDSISAIFYRSWSVEQGWSPKVDILIPPLGSGAHTVQGVFLDNQGYLNLIFANFSDKGGEIWYSKALASIADRATSWSTPVTIGTKAGPLPYASITGDGNGKMVMLYGSTQAGNGLYETHTFDYGATWSNPKSVALYLNNSQWPDSINMIFDHAGNLQVVWGVVNETGVGDEVDYMRASPDFSQWDQYTVMARREGNDYSTTWPSIIENGDNLIVIYQDSFPATHWMRISNDLGASWQMPVRPFPEIGEYENAILLKDSQGSVYMVMGNRTVDPEIHGMWFSRWLGSKWTPLVPVISGPISPVFDPSAPQAVMVQGNTILATWWHNVRRENLSGAWYSYVTLDVPQNSLVPLPSPTPQATDTPYPDQGTGSPVDATEALPGSINTTSPGSSNPSIPIFIGMIPVVIAIPVVIVLRRRNSHN